MCCAQQVAQFTSEGTWRSAGTCRAHLGVGAAAVLEAVLKDDCPVAVAAKELGKEVGKEELGKDREPKARPGKRLSLRGRPPSKAVKPPRPVAV